MEGHPLLLPSGTRNPAVAACPQLPACLRTINPVCLLLNCLCYAGQGSPCMLLVTGSGHPFQEQSLPTKQQPTPGSNSGLIFLLLFLYTSGWPAHVTLTLGKGGPGLSGPHWVREESHYLSWAPVLRSSPQVPCHFGGMEVRGSIPQQQPLPLHCSWH